MKKIIALVGLLFAGFALGFTPIKAADELPIEGEVIVVEDETVEGEPILEDEEVFLAELNETLAVVFAWVGGFSGLGALLLFALRFIRERGVLKLIREEVEYIKEQTDGMREETTNLVESSNARAGNDEALEKAFIGLIEHTNLDAKTKKEVIAALRDDTVKISKIASEGLERVVKAEAAKKSEEDNITRVTDTLLRKLAEQEREV